MYKRISSSMLYLSTQTNIMKNTSKLNELNTKISSGKKVEKPSDDPVAKRMIMAENKIIREYDTYKKNSNFARNQLQSAYDALTGVHDILNHVKELTLQMANDTVNPDDRLTAREQVLQAMDDIRSYANTQMDGFYIFAGYRTATVPFDNAGNYNGDSNSRTVEISPSIYKKVSFPGDAVFKGTGGGIDIFRVLNDLQNALLNNDTQAIEDRIDELDNSMNQILKFQTEAGSLIQEVDITSSVIEANLLQSKVRKSDLEDLDVAAALSEFSMAQTALQTTMATTAEVLKVSLLNYLR